MEIAEPMQTTRSEAADAQVEVTRSCPLCGGGIFREYKKRPLAECASCKAKTRIRVAALFLTKVIKLQPGQRVLHFAPEPQIYQLVYPIVGDGYEPCDFDPARYEKRLPIPIRRFDLCSDARDLPSDTYDLVMHNHVLEHVPCNWTLVLQHLQRAVKPGGAQLFSVPISLNRGYEEDLNPKLSEAERNKRFMQGDHLRRFGRKDFAQTLGAVFDIPDTYSLEHYFTAEELHRAGIWHELWNVSGASAFYVPKR
jgi:phosphoglycolate phosphatase